MDSLRLSLESMTSQGYSGTLSELVKLTKIKPKSTRKADVVDALHNFYSNPDSADELFRQLSEYEKALITCIVQSKYHPLDEEIRDIAKKYKHTKNSSSYYYGYGYRAEYFPKDSKLHAFFIKGEVPQVFKNYLEKAIPPYTRVFSPAEVGNMDDYALIIGRQARYKDFDMLLSFINNNKVAATKAGGYMNKTSLLKFQNITKYEELCNNDSGEINDIRNSGETIVSFGLIQLLRCADVIDIVKEKFVLSQNASVFASLSMLEKAKFLYDAYMRHGNKVIDECARIFSAKLKFSRSVYDLSGPRREIISLLKECPANEWIDFRKFSTELYKKNNRLLAVTGGALIRDDYYNKYYNSASWNDCEHCAVSVVLMEYLATLGAVDILAQEKSHSDYDDYYAYETSYFRLTDLGCYLLGMTDVYEEKRPDGVSDDEKGFIVQPNFDIVIPNGKDRMRHELFFDRFMEKAVNDEEVSLYKLDFKSMVNALNIGLAIREINSYCETFSTVPLSDNVKEAFSDWEVQSSRIKIRTATIIETDDRILLEEIKNYKGMDAISEDALSVVLILNPGSEKKAKGLIEKNKRLCVLRS